MIKDMKYMMEHIFSNIELPLDKQVNILEVGTGNGDGTTVYLNDILKRNIFDYKIHSYEGIDEYYKRATSFWNARFDPKVKIINKFFCNKEDVAKMVLPNIIGEGNIMTKEHYTENYNKILETGVFEGDIDYTPDIILIDSWRFGHAAIVNKCKKYCDENTIFIVEDDFREYGEEEILKRYFDLKNLKRFDGKLSDGTWNFITFNL
tara:strand:+ start:346 stop:963 length:618 start_codon:yes stop_codon:yes gene_type:complete